jgi:hypothetical protein
VREADTPLLGAIILTLDIDRTDIVRFSEIWNLLGLFFAFDGTKVSRNGTHTIPTHDLDQIWLHYKHLLPSIRDELLAHEHPVLATEMWSEPW